jgi:dTDP-D-glucose 4,6-dehydratase
MSLAETFLKEWKSVSNDGYYAHPGEVAESLDLRFVETNIIGTWRWGEIVREVYTNETEFFAIEYLDVSGDGDIDASGRSVEAYDVVPQEVTVIKYVKA